MSIQGLRDPALLRQACLIGGNWRAASSGRTIDVIDPATQEAIGSVPDADGDDTRTAVEAAAAAFEAWRAKPNAERAALLEAWHALMLEHVEDLALILTREQGKPLAEARGEIRYGASFVKWFAEEARRIDGAEKARVVDFPGARLVAAGAAGDLDVMDVTGVAFPCVDHVAMDHLRLIGVELQAQIGLVDLVDDLARQIETVQEIARYVIAVHRLDGQADAGGLRAGPFEIAQKGCQRRRSPRLAGHDMQMRDLQRLGVKQRAFEIAAKA